ncbi:MAG: hypothetical protein NW237_09155 [Cyanobacteriota bacterium]|nr:hypothetical protein [Cyanobacteriota bacterium]
MSSLGLLSLSWLMSGCGGTSDSTALPFPDSSLTILVDPDNGPLKTLQEAISEADRQQNATPNLNVLIEIVGSGSESLTSTLSLDGGNGTNGGKVTVQTTEGSVPSYQILTGLADLIIPAETQLNDLSVSLNNGGQLQVTGGQIQNSKITVASQQSQIRVSGSPLSGLLDLVIDCQQFADSCLSLTTDATLQRIELTHSSQQTGSIGIKVEAGSRPNILDSLVGIVGAANQVGIQFESNTGGQLENVEVDGAKEAGENRSTDKWPEGRVNVTQPTTGMVLAASDANPTIRQSRFRVGQFSSSAGIRILAGTQPGQISENDFVSSRPGSGIGIRVAAGTPSLVVNEYLNSNTFDDNLLIAVGSNAASATPSPQPGATPVSDPEPTPTGPQPNPTPDPTVITTLADEGEGSLRQAILTANGLGQPVEITFAAELVSTPITIALTESLPTIETVLTLTSPAADLVTIDGQGATRLFAVQPGASLTLNNLTLTRGFHPERGGSLLNEGGSLTLQGVVVRESIAPVGGGIYNAAGFLTILGGSLSANQATGVEAMDEAGGGAIASSGGGIVTLVGTTLSNNTAVGDGGAVMALEGFLTVVSTFLTGNTTTGATPQGSDGGAIFSRDSLVTLETAEITDNVAADDGGGLWVLGGSTNILNTRIVNNQAGDAYGGLGILNNPAFSITTTTLSGNSSGTGLPASDSQEGLIGGGAGILGSTGAILNSQIDNNSTVRLGGGLWIGERANVTLTNISLTANTAEYGGGVFMNNSRLTIAGSSFVNNSATFDGGAIFDNRGVLLPTGIPLTGDGMFLGIEFMGNTPNNLNSSPLPLLPTPSPTPPQE